MTNMTPAEAKRLTLQLLSINGLTGWRVEFGSAQGRAGSCWHDQKKIRLSRQLLAQRTYAGSLDTIRHEVAHAICGRGAGHGAEWKRTFKRLGGTGTRCWDQDSLLWGYVYRCSKCDEYLGRTAGLKKLTNKITLCCRAEVSAKRVDFAPAV